MTQDTDVPMRTKAVGAVGGLSFAAGGALMGAMNAGWGDLERDTNDVFPLLGFGVALLVVGLALAGWISALSRAGPGGLAAVVLLVVAPIVYLISWIIEFAIFGTFALGLGLILLAGTMWRRRFASPLDRVLVTVAAVGSLTWNTETLSAFLLVGVGLVWSAVFVRLQRLQERPSASP